MLRFSNPPVRPAGFDAQVATARAKIERIINARATPKSKDFDDTWGRFKRDLLTAQSNKWGYCELWLATYSGDVEHYRPKAELQDLPDDEKKWGKEGEGLFSVEGRTLVTVSDTGYWWEAYSWDNYLAACNRCNSGWKRNLFPISEKPRGAPVQGRGETPLLLNPFIGEDPADHLEYDRLGQIRARNGSAYGKATIATCGLDRPSLVQARNEKVTRAFALLDEYATAKKEERAKVLKGFIEMGSENRIFAGMVRAIFKQNLKLPWQECELALEE